MKHDDNSVIPLTVDQAHIVTGIDNRHLKQMNQGIMSPSDDHIDRFNQTLGEAYLESYNWHTVPVPETIETAKGSLPENHVLIRRTTVGELRVGDLVPYIPNKRSRKSLWVEVRSIKSDETEENSEVLEIDLGGIVQYFQPFAPIRVARPNK